MIILLRIVFGLGLIASLLCFAAFAFTGQVGWRQHGVRILKWTLIAALAVGAGILGEHLLPLLNA